MENILIILTHSYPYAPPTEQFLHQEIDMLENYYDKIFVIPTSHSSWVEDKSEISSQKVIVSRIRRKKKSFEVFKSLTSAVICNKDFYMEMLILIKKKQIINSIAIKTLLMTLVNTKIISKYVVNEVIPKKLNRNANIVIYSYWLSHLSNAGIEIKEIMLKNGFSKVKTISRAHGSSDVFLGMKMNGYKPGLLKLNHKLNKIFSISTSGKIFLENLGFNSSLITVSRLGVSDCGLKVSKKNKDEFLIVSCSNLVKIKRVELIVEAIKEIKDYEIHWIHFGDGPERQRIEELASIYFSNNIKFTLKGNMENQDILDFYKCASPDLFINVSSVEGIPVSIMEAISFGIPIIATDVGGTSEICINKYNGILLNENFCVLELVDSIKYFIEMRTDIYNSYCNNARNVYEKKFNSEVNYRKFAKDLTTVLEE